MKKILFLLLPILVFADNFNNFQLPVNKTTPTFLSKQELAECYNNGLGDSKCGKELALILKNEPEKEELAADIFLDLSLKGDVEATRELALLFIYGKKIQRDCKKGIYILLNAADGRSDKKQSTLAFKEISKLFKEGICVEKDLKKAKKYNDIYMKRIKEEIK